MLAVNRSYGGSEFDKVCRLCSSNNGIIVLNIFHGEGKKRRILSLINACLPVKISEYDPLPKVICHHCLHKLEVFREFQENCLKSEETLRNGGPSCSVTYPTFSNSSQDYVQNEPEETAPHFAAEIHPLPPDPLFHQQPVPAEQNAEEEIIDIRRDHFLPPRSELEVIVVKQEPQDRSPAPEEDIRWQDSTAEDENGMQMEHSELDSLPPEEEVKSEGFTSAEPVIRVERDFIVTKTNRGKRCLLRGRYKYRKARETRGGFIIWRCTNSNCSALLRTDNECTILFNSRNVHNHEEISWQKLARSVFQKVCKCKRWGQNGNLCPCVAPTSTSSHSSSTAFYSNSHGSNTALYNNQFY